jgi:ankyrin repeat protein
MHTRGTIFGKGLAQADKLDRTPADIDFDRWISSYPAEDRREHLFRHDDEILHKRKFSRLHSAVLGLRLPDTETLLQLGWDDYHIDDLDIDQRTPLYWAIRRRDVHSTKALLAYGANPQAGMSPIAWACKDPCTEPELLNILLESGVSPNSHDSDGHTALHACGIFGRDSRFLHALDNHGAEIDTPYTGPYRGYQGITALGFSALYGHSATLKRLLQLGANPSIVDREGRTPVHLAIQSSRKSSRIECLTTLLQAGADTSLRDNKNRNAANTAMSFQDLDCLQLLIDHGADLIFPLSSEQGRLRNVAYDIILWPLKERQIEVVKFLLERIDLHDKDPVSGRTVLHAIAKYGTITTLVTFENLLDSQEDVSCFPVDKALYDLNEEMQKHARFDSLLRRLAGRQQQSTNKADRTSKSGDSSLLGTTGSLARLPLDEQFEVSGSICDDIDDDAEYFDAPTHFDYMKLVELTSQQEKSSGNDSMALPAGGSQSAPSRSEYVLGTETSQAILTPITMNDKGFESAKDSQSGLFPDIWHTGNIFAVEKEFEDDRDSGYGSDLSETSDDDDRALQALAPNADIHQYDSSLRRRLVQHTIGITEEFKTTKTNEEEEDALTNNRVNEGRMIDTEIVKGPATNTDACLHENRLWRVFEYLIVAMVALCAIMATAWLSLKTSHAAFRRFCQTFMRPKILPDHARATWICVSLP